MVLFLVSRGQQSGKWMISSELSVVNLKSPIGTSRSFPDGLVVKNRPANLGDTGNVDSSPESGRSPEEGNGSPPQYSCLENSMDREARRAIVYGVTKRWT